jgi:Fur family ferric uptake transcriptional regulator
MHNLLYGRQLKYTKQRKLILSAFLEIDHVTARELHILLKKKGHRMALGTIYRTMNLFCQMGYAQPRHFKSQTQFDNTFHKGHHDHLICISCGHIKEFEDREIESLQTVIAESYGYVLTTRKLELYGLCSSCSL